MSCLSNQSPRARCFAGGCQKRPILACMLPMMLVKWAVRVLLESFVLPGQE